MLSISAVLAWVVLTLALIGVLLICLFSLLWRYRHTLIEAIYALLVVSILFAISSGVAFFVHFYGTLYGLLVITGVFLAARLRIGRMPEQFLRRNTLSTTLVVLVVFVAALVAAPYFIIVFSQAVMLGVLLAAFIVASGLSLQTAWALSHYIFDVKAETAARHKLPTLTLAIPARNETMALSSCLDAVLQSDYPKLEILVLDDCSHDNTSALIRSYAHLGVRFIKGDAPSSGWLGKTNAYSQLAKEASGEIVLFLSVDTHVQPQSISRLVTYMEAHRLDMVSVLPKTEQPLGAAVLLQELRYVWQVILPLRHRRVPVSSEAWAIRRSVLTALGGFSGVKHKIIPEGSFARRLMAANRYHFVIANHILPMGFTKSWRSQHDTAIRLLYPTFKRRPLPTMAAVALILILGIGPFLALLAKPFSSLWWLSAVTCLLYLVLYASILMRLQARWWWLSVWLLPFVLLQQIILTLVSMARYEFSTVDWKGRNVCYPVLLHKRR